jgi:CHASE2 domain
MSIWYKALWFPLLAASLSFGLLQIEGIERSFLGAPDREMLQSAFKLRDGVARGSGDPILWLDLDYDALASYAQSRGRASPVAMAANTGPSPVVPRKVLAATLAYARQPGATLVVLDVDIGWSAPDSDGEAQLEAELKAWAADPNAPLLLLAREVLYLPNGATLMPTRFDTIVSSSSNIAYASVNMLSGGGGVKEFVASQCYWSQNRTPLYLPSVVSFADAAQAAYRVHGVSPMQSQARSLKSKIIKQSAANTTPCAQGSLRGSQNGVVSWHIGYAYPATIRAAQVNMSWPHQSLCQLSGPPPTAARISVADMWTDPKAASAAPLCRRMVIIGGDNAIAKDRSATPIGMLPGPLILANAMRGHFDTGPIVRGNWSALRLSLQVALLFFTVICIVWAFEGIASLRQWLKSKKAIGPTGKFLLFVTHPLCFKFVVAFATFGLGVLVTALSLELGFWGLLSAPAYFATLFEAWKQINADKSPTKPTITSA